MITNENITGGRAEDSSARLGALLDRIELSTLTSESADDLKYSLFLPTETEGGEEGDVITWQSSNTAVITQSGRVIRPWSDAKDETVSLTVRAENGDEHAERTFTFTVRAEEELRDPQYISDGYMSDAEFFGVWNKADGRWEREGKFDYDREGLGDIAAAVKDGDYVRASEALLEYMRGRKIKLPVGLWPRNDEYADMILDDIYHHVDWSYLQGGVAEVEATDDFTDVSVPLRPSVIARGGTNTYSVRSRYNECSSLVVLSKETWRGASIVLTVNGKKRVYYANADAIVRTGRYKDTNYGAEHEMEVKTFGPFLGDDTTHLLLRFDFPDLCDSDEVTAARLVMMAKVKPAFAGSKSIIVNYEPNNTWDEDTVCYNSLIGCVYNYNGVPGGTDWGAVEGCDYEYLFSMTRFHSWRNAASTYIETKNEWYPYRMIRQMMDFIVKRGCTMHSPDVSWGDQEIRGGWKRTLDTAERLRSWVATVDILMSSRYMTPECCKAILKQIWDMNDVLTKSKVTGGNWAQNESMAILQGALTFPEFSSSKKWINCGMEKNESLIYRNHFSDGTYSEATGGYSLSSFLRFMQYKKLMFDYGIAVSKEYDEMLRKAAYYNLLLRGPGGEYLQYGDERAGKSRERLIPEMLNWYGDTDLEFIDTFGAAGTEPSWKSKHFPESRVTMMRADWSTSSPFIFTNVRGSGGHGDDDDNSITLVAYDRILLCDAGVFTYRRTDPYSTWGRSTEAHNTVEINGMTQWEDAGLGKVHAWVTNDIFDFISQSADGYSHIEIEHQRTITFLKPNIVIVSDAMIPRDKRPVNTYRQIWHMLPTANLSIDRDENVIRSNYPSGANIIIASADEEYVEVGEKDGWYDYGYQNLAQSRFGYFEKKKKIDTTMDTVLIPYAESARNVRVRRLDHYTNPVFSTLIEVTGIIDGRKVKIDYMLNYDYDGKYMVMHKRGDSDAFLTVVSFDENGKSICECIIVRGSHFILPYGEIIINCGRKVEWFAYRVDGDAVTVTTSEENTEGMMLCADVKVASLTVNGRKTSFTQKNTTVMISKPC